jgi:undecaprenyl-diphosphatase
MAHPIAFQSFDESVLRAALSTPAPLVTAFFVITTIGGGWGLIALLPFALRRSTRAATLWFFAAATLTSGVVSLIKALVGRVRPCDALPWCAALSAGSPGGPSFPSGHAAGSFAFAAFVAGRAPRFASAAFLFAALVAWSRCVLGVHYPTDILTGALIGALIGGACARISIKSPKGSGSTSPRQPGGTLRASQGEPLASSRRSAPPGAPP